MKKRQVLAGLIALSVIALGTVALAAAQEPLTYYPSINYNSNKWVTVWWLKTNDPTVDPPSFDGRTIVRSTITAYADVDGIYVTVKPLLIINLKDYVFLVFLTRGLPADALDGVVTGTLANGDTFIASGPGWSFGAIH